VRRQIARVRAAVSREGKGRAIDQLGFDENMGLAVALVLDGSDQERRRPLKSVGLNIGLVARAHPVALRLTGLDEELRRHEDGETDPE
jgi:hypothetical protein